MITATILIIIAALVALACCLIITRLELADVKRERDCAHNATNARNAEIEHLRKVQAAKIDRALFMLVSIRAKRVNDRGVIGVVRVTLELSDVMHVALMDNNELAVEGLCEILAGHIARRLDKATA